MKRYIFVCVALLFISKVFGQTKVNDSIVYLNEIVITNTKHLRKHKKVKTKGKSNMAFAIKQNASFISLIDNLPKGEIQSIYFYSKHKKNSSNESLTFRLRVYSSKENKPNKDLLTQETRFEINGNKETIVLDVSKLQLSTEEQLFIGLELLEYKEGINYSISCNANTTNTSFVKIPDYQNWVSVPNMCIKTKLIIKE